MKSPIDEECENIAKNPRAYIHDDFPPDDRPLKQQQAIRFEARRRIGLNWPEVFGANLDRWAYDRTLLVSVQIDRQDRLAHPYEKDGSPRITLFLGHEEFQAFRYYLELTHYANHQPMSEKEREEMKRFNVVYIFNGIGIVPVTMHSYWRFV